jgi:ribosomal protein L37AE/L43A
MDVITMPSTISILNNLKSDYSQFTFELGDDFHWFSPTNTIYYENSSDDQYAFLFHELSHALLGHANYSKDIELVSMERQAWELATKIAQKYGFFISDEIIQLNLDSYRDWMHARSTCPDCSATGLQVNKSAYKCPSCSHKWTVNDARTSALRRYSKK